MLSQNECSQCVPDLTHAEISRPARRHWTEKWQLDDVGPLGDVHYQTEPNLSVFTARCSAQRGYEIACRLSVCPSV